MRKSRIIALVVASLVSAASVAGAQDPMAKGAGVARGERGGMRREMEGRPGRALMRGIRLSEAEKAAVRQVHEKYKAEYKTLRESMRPSLQTARAARQKGDTVAAKAAWAAGAADRGKIQALRERAQADVRAALTPEHQKLFDANVQRMTQRGAEWEKGGRKGKGHGRGDR